jgi:hypothetical protein
VALIHYSAIQDVFLEQPLCTPPDAPRDLLVPLTRSRAEVTCEGCLEALDAQDREFPPDHAAFPDRTWQRYHNDPVFHAKVVTIARAMRKGHRIEQDPLNTACIVAAAEWVDRQMRPCGKPCGYEEVSVRNGVVYDPPVRMGVTCGMRIHHPGPCAP